MRVYYRMGETKISSDDNLEVLNRMTNENHILILELIKYKIMWHLRSLEDEINASNGTITIASENLYDKIKIEGHGFSRELGEKINAIASKVKI